MTRQKWALFLITLTLIAATIAAYEPIRHNDFVNYDDEDYITKNPDVQKGITIDTVVWAFTQPHKNMWHPLTTISHMLDYQLFRLDAPRHHIVSVVFHLINTVLLFWILTNLTGSIWPSAFVAAVFALHPVQVESVAWVSERKTVLSGLFWLLTMAVYIWYSRRPSIRRYIPVFLIYGLCIMTKPVVVTLPLAMLLLDYWPLERLGGQKTEDRRRRTEDRGQKAKDTSQKVSIGRLIAEKVPLLVLSAILSVMTFIFQRGEAVITLERLPITYRITNMFVSYIRYIGKIIWPSKLAVFYPHPRESFFNAVVIFCILIFIVLCVYSIYAGRRRKYIAMGWLWFIVTLIPVIGLVQSGNQAMANRYMYLAMPGLLIIIAWSIKDLIANRPRWKVFTAVSAIIVLSLALILTRMQVKHWKNSISLFDYVLKVTQNNTLAENNYGCAMYDIGQVDEAIRHLKNAIQINPTCFYAGLNLGRIFIQQDKLDEAIRTFNELLPYYRDSAQLNYNLGIAFNNQKKYDEAIKYFKKTLELDPKYPDALNRTGIALMSSNRIDEAIACFNKLLKEKENSAEAHYNMAVALGLQKKYDEAIKHLSGVLIIDPNYPDARKRLALAMMATGKIDEAAAYFNELVKRNENSEEAHYNLAVILGMQKRYDEAIKHLSNVLKTNPNYPDARNKMGVALVATGKLDEATECFNELLKQNENSAEAHYNLGVILAMQKRYDEAIQHFAKVLDLEPKYPNAHNSMIAALMPAGRSDEAIALLNEKLRKNGDHAEVYVDLGAIYNQLGKYKQATENWTNAVELKPDNIGALNGLAWLLAVKNVPSAEDANKAVTYAKRACELTGNKSPALLDTLSAAYAAAGRFEEAIKTAEQAIETAKSQNIQNLVSEIESRLELYKAGKPYREK